MVETHITNSIHLFPCTYSCQTSNLCVSLSDPYFYPCVYSPVHCLISVLVLPVYILCSYYMKYFRIYYLEPHKASNNINKPHSYIYMTSPGPAIQSNERIRTWLNLRTP